MNLERSEKIPKKHQTPEYLEQACWRMADMLAAHRWNRHSINRVSFGRQIFELVIDEVESSGEVQDMPPLTNEISASFSAQKLRVLDEDGFENELITYQVVSTVTQPITSAEMPALVLDKIFSKDIDKDEDDLVGSILIDDDISRDTLDTLYIERQQEVVYDIDGSGAIDSYTLTYNYLFDEEIAYQATYSSEDGKLLTVPIYPKDDGDYIDAKPLLLTTVHEHDIAAEATNLDDELVTFIDSHAMKDTFELGSATKQEHIRRVLAIMAMLRSGFVPH